jgi:hypothetical protein
MRAGLGAWPLWRQSNFAATRRAVEFMEERLSTRWRAEALQTKSYLAEEPDAEKDL